MSNYTAMGLDLGVQEDSNTNISQVLVIAKGIKDDEIVYSVLTSGGMHQVEVDELASFAKAYTSELMRALILGSRPYQSDEDERPEEK